MSTPAGRLTALARSIDPRVSTTRFALLAAAGATVVTAAATYATAVEPTVGSALGRGVAYGVGTFLAWAIARELHPDAPHAAVLAVGAYVPAMLLGTPALAALTAILLAARITVRTTGRPPTRLDLAAMVGLAGFAATTPAGLVAALGLAWSLHDDRILPTPAPDREHEVAAVTAAAVALASTVVSDALLSGWRGPTLAEAVWLLVVVVAVSRLRRPERLDSRGDLTDAPLHLDRLVRARRLTLVVLAAALGWAGAASLPALAPAAAAVVGTALVGVLPARDATPSTELA